MADYDVLLVGHNELDFQQYYNILDNMASSGGRDHVAFTDMRLNCVELNGKPYQGQDLLSHFYNAGKPPEQQQRFYNGDCLWTGIAYLGSYLHKRGYTFDFVNLFHLEKDSLREKLQTNTYRAVVLTGTMYVFEQNIYELVVFIKKYNKDVKVFAGGPYISKQAEEREAEYLRPLFKYLNADIYCYSREGEQTLLKVIDALRDGTDLRQIPNLAFKQGREFVVTPAKREVNSLEENMIDYALFASAYGRSGWANVRVSEGCPYACGFCAFPEHNNERYETMSLERIEREFDAIREAGTISNIFFIDATLNVPRNHFKEMLQLMIRKQYGFKWHSFFRCDQTDEETIDLMKLAGCEGVFLGLESASDIVLRNMDKGAHKRHFRQTMPWFKRAGITQMISVQIGFPGETYDTYRETMDFIEEINPDFTRPQIWFCDPTTPVWRRRGEFKLRGKGYGWSHYTMDAETAVELVVEAFMSLEGPAWVPDPGYNWVMLYAMKKNGMSLERQKAFLRFFSAAAKAKLLMPTRRVPPPELVDNLAICAAFDGPGEPDMTALAPFSGRTYREAEAFWVETFRSCAPAASGLSASPEEEDTEEEDTDEDDVDADSEVTEVVAPRSRAEAAFELPQPDLSDDYVLAAFTVFLAGLQQRELSPVIVSVDQAMPFPIRVAAQPSLTFDELLAEVESARAAAEPFRLFGLFVLTNALRMKEFGAERPALDAAFLVATDAEAGTDVVDTRLKDAPAAQRDLHLVALVQPAQRGRGRTLTFSSPSGRYSSPQLSALIGTFGGVLQLAAAGAGVDGLRFAAGAPAAFEVPVATPRPEARSEKHEGTTETHAPPSSQSKRHLPLAASRDGEVN